MPRIAKPLPDAAFLNAVFALDTETGILTWKSRPEHLFNHPTHCKATNARCAGRRADKPTRNGYRRIQITINGKQELFGAHRIIWKMVTGRDPPEQIDHIDRNRSNNAIANLREATPLENAQNKRHNNPNGVSYRGTCVYAFRGGKFRAQVKALGITHYLGIFASAEDASRAVAEFRSVRARIQRETDDFERGNAAWAASFAA